MLVKRASIADLDAVAPLFDAYRQFYGQRTDLAGARAFLGERLRRDESVIFLAVADGGPGNEALGFTQLYPSFSSVSVRRLWILNDLFVRSGIRRGGVGRRLLASERVGDRDRCEGADAGDGREQRRRSSAVRVLRLAAGRRLRALRPAGVTLRPPRV